MLEQARRMAKERGLDNVEVRPAYADALPVDDAAADLVTCRTAPHHFPSVTDFLTEVARVLKPGGTFILADTSAPENDDLDAWMNDMELRRDRTHVRDLKHSEWRALLAEAGFEQNFEATTRVYLETRDWCARTGVSDTDLDAIMETWRTAPQPVVEAFQISPSCGPNEDYSFSWPVFVTRTIKT
jgi:ubiquinone/menaquinone biosynthesis C-methylase UbiE